MLNDAEVLVVNDFGKFHSHFECKFLKHINSLQFVLLSQFYLDECLIFSSEYSSYPIKENITIKPNAYLTFSTLDFDKETRIG
jgi:hypothetical protein